jgi:hypothetical protein
MTKENIPLQPGEEIKPIIGYEGLYSITSFGRVWSHEKVRKFGRQQRIRKAKFLKPSLNKKTSYLYVNLYIEGKLKTFNLHRFVAIVFISNPLNDLQVNHKDGIKTNNRIDNLEWCTDQQNHNHASKTGLKYKFTSIYYGVYFNKGLAHKKKPWCAQITMNKKQIHIGFFKTEIEAARAYNEFVIKHGLNRPLNNLGDK